VPTPPCSIPGRIAWFGFRRVPETDRGSFCAAGIAGAVFLSRATALVAPPPGFAVGETTGVRRAHPRELACRIRCDELILMEISLEHLVIANPLRSAIAGVLKRQCGASSPLDSPQIRRPAHLCRCCTRWLAARLPEMARENTFYFRSPCLICQANRDRAARISFRCAFTAGG
jgi:hypothetical protein